LVYVRKNKGDLRPPLALFSIADLANYAFVAGTFPILLAEPDVSRGLFQLFLGHIQDDPDIVMLGIVSYRGFLPVISPLIGLSRSVSALFGLELKRSERDTNILLADPEEAADPNRDGDCGTLLIKNDVIA
jgi:hypothetical protein